MNTVKSFWLGMGSLCVAGGTTYYFAKKSINEERHNRYREAEEKRRRLEANEHPEYNQSNPSSTHESSIKSPQTTTSASQEASLYPTPTRHDPENEVQRVREKSKYEASEPYRSRKGDRFS